MPETHRFQRSSMLGRLRGTGQIWDLIVIGGGATGLGIALDAASRGHTVALLEKGDFAGETSAASTKLIHGGVRYLQQGNLALVREALLERSRLLRNAPHIVHPKAFTVPAYRPWDRLYYGAGLTAYDLLSGAHGLGRTSFLSADETRALLPEIRPEGLLGGVRYYDAQFDDARLALAVARTAAAHGAVVVNHCPAIALEMDPRGHEHRVIALDRLRGQELTLRARAVVAAAGPFTDQLRQLADPDILPRQRPSRGTHIVLERRWLSGESALMLPRTPDNRVLFLVPWEGALLVGTTDLPAQDADQVQPTHAEVAYLLELAGRYLDPAPSLADVRSVFTGIRPLVASDTQRHTRDLVRNHAIWRDPSGMYVITGGKWTTYRHMAQELVNTLEIDRVLSPRRCITAELRLVGAAASEEESHSLARYGAERTHVSRAGTNARIHPALPYTEAEIRWAVREEMAHTLADVLGRRTRALYLDRDAALASAPSVGRILAEELGHSESWLRHELRSFERLVAERFVAR